MMLLVPAATDSNDDDTHSDDEDEEDGDDDMDIISTDMAWHRMIRCDRMVVALAAVMMVRWNRGGVDKITHRWNRERVDKTTYNIGGTEEIR